MKNTLYLFISLAVLFASCASDGTNTDATTIKKKGEEAPFVERYMKDMISSPTTQDHIDRNLIVNHLIDKQLDFKKTDSGIYYTINTPGEGGNPSMSSRITAHYKGTLLDGTKFDSSYDKNRPLVFTLGQVVAAWQEVIPMLQKGGKGTFIVPSRLAYGPQSKGSVIKANSVLVFEIELLNFK